MFLCYVEFKVYSKYVYTGYFYNIDIDKKCEK